MGVRPQTDRIENALNALHQIDYMLEVGMAEQVESQIPLDIDLMGSLVWTVQEHARYLSEESRSAPVGYTTESHVDAAASYAEAAADAFLGFLARIDTVAKRLRARERSADAEIVEGVTAMLADPWVQQLRNQRSER
jgi:colicin import membrane protein